MVSECDGKSPVLWRHDLARVSECDRRCPPLEWSRLPCVFSNECDQSKSINKYFDIYCPVAINGAGYTGVNNLLVWPETFIYPASTCSLCILCDQSQAWCHYGAYFVCDRSQAWRYYGVYFVCDRSQAWCYYGVYFVWDGLRHDVTMVCIFVHVTRDFAAWWLSVFSCVI